MPDILSLTVRGRIPSKKNSRAPFSNRGRIPLSAKYLQWERDAAIQIIKHKGLKIEHAEIFMIFYFPDNRRVDLDNKITSIMDLLAKIEIIADDCWQVVRRIAAESGGVDKDNPRVDINITTL